MTCDQGNLGPGIEWLWDKKIGDIRKLIRTHKNGICVYVLCNANNMHNIQCLFIFQRERQHRRTEIVSLLYIAIIFPQSSSNHVSLNIACCINIATWYRCSIFGIYEIVYSDGTSFSGH